MFRGQTSFLGIGFGVFLFGQAWCGAQTFSISTVAGGGLNPNTGGQATGFDLATPIGVFAENNAELLVVDSSLCRVFQVSTEGYITAVAGSPSLSGGYAGNGGPAIAAELNAPQQVAVDSSGNLYIADDLNNVIRLVSSAGKITTFAGNNQAESAPGGTGDGGPAASAELSGPLGVAVDASGNVYISDSSVNRIRKVSNGIITTIAGTGGQCCSGEGGPAVSAAISSPQQLALDPAGNLYFAEGNCVVDEVTTAGTLVRIAGNGTLGYSGDGGPATSAQLSCAPGGVAVDASGNVYIADTYNNVIRKVSNGIITTVAGNGNCGYSGDGGPATTGQLCEPIGLSVSGNNVYVADWGNGRVRLLTSSVTLGPSPAITSGGVVPIYSSSSTIQPGSWVSIYGSNLIPGSTPVNWTGNYPTTLGGATVTINGNPAYISYAAPTLLNVEAPDDTTRGSVNVTVTTINGTSTTSVTLANQSPSFSLLSDAKHVAGIILRPDGSGAFGGGENSYDIIGPAGTSLGYKTVPAQAGNSVVLFGVGFGPTSPAVPAGQTFSGAAPATSTINLTINGQAITTSFAGLSSPGLFQFNLTMPSGLGTGDQPIVASVGGASTQANIVIALQ
jgi:uncharacterized protein (TIGR03437 family)